MDVVIADGIRHNASLPSGAVINAGAPLRIIGAAAVLIKWIARIIQMRVWIVVPCTDELTGDVARRPRRVGILLWRSIRGFWRVVVVHLNAMPDAGIDACAGA